MATITIKFLEKQNKCEKYSVHLMGGGLGSTDGSVTYLDCNSMEKTVYLTMVRGMALNSRDNSRRVICATKILNSSNEDIFISKLNEDCNGTETDESLNPSNSGDRPIIIEN